MTYRSKEIETAMRAVKRGRKGAKCSVSYCTNLMQLGDYPCQGDHLLPRGQFPELAAEPFNIRPTCGCHNDIESLNLKDRLLYIRRAWPQRFEWCLNKARRRLHPDEYDKLTELYNERDNI